MANEHDLRSSHLLPHDHACEHPGAGVFATHEWEHLSAALNLSPREVQVLRGIFDDRTEAGIAFDLGISPHTVHTHIERLYRKLGVASHCALVVRIFAVHRALPHPDEGSMQSPHD